MKKTFEIKNRFSGEIIYSGEFESIKDCIESAVKLKIDLSVADLRGAYLSGADLSEADLRGADLSEAYLRGADLSEAYLRGADLREAYLSGADLSEADLRGAYLSEADLRGAYLSEADLRGARIPLYCKWSFGIKDDKIFIGCKEKTAKEWEEWLASEEEYETKRGTPEFKQIEACIRASIAYYNVLNQ